MAKSTAHPIQVVARRTGLSPDVIRVWERRYGAVSPERSDTNRRLYSDGDVERLLLLRRATLSGRRIGDVADLSTPELEELVQADEAASVHPEAAAVRNPARVESAHVEACMAAIEELDGERLERALGTAAIELTRPQMIDGLIHPLVEHIGDRWREGTLRPAHEHLATAVVRSFLAGIQDARPDDPQRPDVVVTSPAGQVHELGALMVAASASLEGWRVTYLGPDLPAEDIAAAVRKRDSRVLALSLVYPADDPRLGDELGKLRRLLGDDVVVIVGGTAAEGYEAVLREIGARRIDDMAVLRRELEKIRYRPS